MKSRAMCSGLLGLAALATGCVDPKGAYDDWQARVPDAARASTDGSTLADIGGNFLVRVQALSSLPLWVYGQVTFMEATDGASIEITMQPVSQADMMITGMLVGDVQPGRAMLDMAASTTISVDASGQFQAHFPSYVFPAEASPIGSAIEANITLLASISSEDCWEGEATGMVIGGSGASLDGNTVFAAVRVSDASDLPEGFLECPDLVMPDASEPDAPDASMDASGDASDSSQDA